MELKEFGSNQKNNMKSINEIVSKTLREKYLLNENFEQISLEEDEDKRLDMTLEYFENLHKEGYDEAKIQTMMNESNWLSRLFGFGGDEKQTTGEKVMSAGTGGAWSQFKEYIIKKFLSFFGFKGPLASAIAVVLVETSLPDLINIFKSREGCLASSAKVSGGILEALVAYIVESGTEQDSMAANFIRNSVFEALRNEGYDKQIGHFVCNMAYKKKGAIAQGIGSNIVQGVQGLSEK